MVLRGRNQDFPGDLASFGVRGLGRLGGHRGEVGAKAARTRVVEAACGAALGDGVAVSGGEGAVLPILVQKLAIRQTHRAYHIK